MLRQPTASIYQTSIMRLFLSLMFEVVTLFHGKGDKSYNGNKYNKSEFKQIQTVI